MTTLLVTAHDRRRLVLERLRLTNRRKTLQTEMLGLNRQLQAARRLRTIAAQRAVRRNLLEQFGRVREIWLSVKAAEQEAARYLGET